ncbi:hypothetical protein AWB75_03460 [Caballeronia catudaia]|uniref:Uncharacterized protein n=1 Tax=Caballeronia catudaia TaxID=1777136 RepID=A0A158BG68_9BURK|nr:hypothetical protein AWB75_03460 [Caballeronia catudaia]
MTFRIVVDTRDAFGGKLTSESDKPSQVLEVPFLNPQNGPVMIEDAEKGDVVAEDATRIAYREFILWMAASFALTSGCPTRSRPGPASEQTCPRRV